MSDVATFGSVLIIVLIIGGLLLLAAYPQMGNLDRAFQAMDAATGVSVQLDLTMEDIEALAPFKEIVTTDIGPRDGETIVVPGYGPVALGGKAERLHGDGAVQARLAMLFGGGMRYDCEEGDTWMIRSLSEDDVACMHIVDGSEISSFVSIGLRDAIRALTLIGCSPGQGGPPTGAALAN